MKYFFCNYSFFLVLDYLQNFLPSKILEDFNFKDRFELFHPIIENNIQIIMEKEIELLESQNEDKMDVINEANEKRIQIYDDDDDDDDDDDTMKERILDLEFNSNKLSVEEIIKKLQMFEKTYANYQQISNKNLNLLDQIINIIEMRIKNLIEEFIEFENLRGWKNYRIEDFEIRLKEMKKCQTIISKLFEKHENSSTESISILSEIKKRKEKRKLKIEEIKKKEDIFWNDIKFKKDNEQYFFFISKFGFIEGKKNYSEWKEISILNQTTELYSSFI